MSQRYFRASASVYEQVRVTLDAAWGHPGPAAITCIEPAATAPRDEAGRVLLAVDAAFCEYAAARELLLNLLASGDVDEIEKADYRPAMLDEATGTWVEA
jgi:hypothetical protein